MRGVYSKVIILIILIMISSFALLFTDHNIKKALFKDIEAYEASNIDLPEIQASDRIIIFSPHPDDESLANSGIIREAVKMNASILVVMMTNGDAYDQSIFQIYLNKNKYYF